MRTSYLKKDVTILLKDITGQIAEQNNLEREKAIQSGNHHYSEMLPIEYRPSTVYLKLYNDLLDKNAAAVAEAVSNVAVKIYESAKDKSDIVLVSLARAGIPAGILIKHFIEWKYRLPVAHYAISIIRDKGIDYNAMNYILKRHAPETLFFIDGWTGKGCIYKELKKSLVNYPGINSNNFAVIADPAYLTDLCGTHTDMLIPSSCLNSTVSGLISRTVLRADLIGDLDFHGAVYYDHLKAEDLSYDFINRIEECFRAKGIADECSIAELKYPLLSLKLLKKKYNEVQSMLSQIMSEYDISDMNKIKPGIGETTRVLLRRIPYKILIHDKKDSDLQHIIQLAEEKNVHVIQYPLKGYKAIGLIKDVDDI